MCSFVHTSSTCRYLPHIPFLASSIFSTTFLSPTKPAMDGDKAPKPSNAAPAEPVRSRWTPKPEQILILESIFNSGMVNPPKDETVRIRKLLEKFGPVGDANVFYWFQNRRSRSRRRQRQLQAGLAAAAGGQQGPSAPTSLYGPAAAASSSSNSSASAGYSSQSILMTSSSLSSAAAGFVSHDSASDDLFAVSRQMGFRDNTSYGSQHGCTVTVFINGIPLEIQRGPIDMTSVFGHEALLVHSSGEVLPVNEHGILMQNLQMGESYFLVHVIKIYNYANNSKSLEKKGRLTVTYLQIERTN